MRDIKIEKNKLRKLREALPHGSIQRIVDSLGKSRQSVYDVLRGDYYNKGIINAAIKEVKNSVGYAKKIAEKIDEVA